MPVWRNWQTRGTQNPVRGNSGVGSIPSTGTRFPPVLFSTLDKNLTTFSVPELILLTEREEAMIETDSRKVVFLEAITAVVRIRPCEGVKEGAK